MVRLDSNHQFWKYSVQDYAWIDSAVERRDILPPDLKSLLINQRISGVISVQTRQSFGETRSLLAMAARRSLIAGVVGWAPLIASNLRDCLKSLMGHRKLVGVRHELHKQPANDLMDNAAFNEGIRALRDFGLSYDLLVNARHLQQAIRFVDRHPGQTFILDCIGKPNLCSDEFELWKASINELARRQNTYFKISGIVTEANADFWTPESLRNYFDVVIEAFGPRRVMFASDWPACLIDSFYSHWIKTVELWTVSWSEVEKERFWAGTAKEAYGISERRGRLAKAASPKKPGNYRVASAASA